MKEEDDIFNPGVTKEQIRRAEELLGNLSIEMFIEKRSSSNTFRPAMLVVPGENAKMIEVLASAVIEGQPGDRTLLAREAIPRLRYAELVIKLAGQNTTLKGRVEPSRPGRRKGDREHEKPLTVTLFHELNE